MRKMSENQKLFYILLVIITVGALLFRMSFDLGFFVLMTAFFAELAVMGAGLSYLWFQDRGRSGLEAIVPAAAIGFALPMLINLCLNFAFPRLDLANQFLLGIAVAAALFTFLIRRKRAGEKLLGV